MKVTIERLDDDMDGSANVLINVTQADKLYLVYKMMAQLADIADEAEPDPDPRPVKTHAGGKRHPVQAVPPWAYEGTMAAEEEEDEEEAWGLFEHMRTVQERNRACMAAWNAAANFIQANAHRLGEISLREAHEKGFLQGYNAALGREDK